MEMKPLLVADGIMKINVSREQTNRSKKKPIYKYTSETEDYCCKKMQFNRGLIVITGCGIYPARHGVALSCDYYNYCPWCGEKFEFIYPPRSTM